MDAGDFTESFFIEAAPELASGSPTSGEGAALRDYGDAYSTGEVGGSVIRCFTTLRNRTQLLLLLLSSFAR